MLKIRSLKTSQSLCSRLFVLVQNSRHFARIVLREKKNVILNRNRHSKSDAPWSKSYLLYSVCRWDTGRFCIIAVTFIEPWLMADGPYAPDRCTSASILCFDYIVLLLPRASVWRNVNSEISDISEIWDMSFDVFSGANCKAVVVIVVITFFIFFPFFNLLTTEIAVFFTGFGLGEARSSGVPNRHEAATSNPHDGHGAQAFFFLKAENILSWKKYPTTHERYVKTWKDEWFSHEKCIPTRKTEKEMPRTCVTEWIVVNQVVAPHELAADAALVDTWAQTPCPNMSLGINFALTWYQCVKHTKASGRFCSTSNRFTVKFARQKGCKWTKTAFWNLLDDPSGCNIQHPRADMACSWGGRVHAPAWNCRDWGVRPSPRKANLRVQFCTLS